MTTPIAEDPQLRERIGRLEGVVRQALEFVARVRTYWPSEERIRSELEVEMRRALSEISKGAGR